MRDATRLAAAVLMVGLIAFGTHGIRWLYRLPEPNSVLSLWAGIVYFAVCVLVAGAVYKSIDD